MFVIIFGLLALAMLRSCPLLFALLLQLAVLAISLGLFFVASLFG